MYKYILGIYQVLLQTWLDETTKFHHFPFSFQIISKLTDSSDPPYRDTLWLGDSQVALR
jgi:hypothetical protein